MDKQRGIDVCQTKYLNKSRRYQFIMGHKFVNYLKLCVPSRNIYHHAQQCIKRLTTLNRNTKKT